ncbi:MAG: methyltransferase domain-containing protein [Anaerolineales bacterium]
MPCAHCQAVETTFGDRSAERRREQMHKRGLDRTTRWLIEDLEAQGVRGASVLDIGGGLGGIMLHLLEAGASSATLVEASSAFLKAARREADERGVSDRVAWLHGDFVELASDVMGADVVCLDRVICCYPDMPGLVGLSSARANRLYGLVLPRRAWWTRLGAWGINTIMWLSRNAFRVFIHRPEAVERIARRNGLEPVYRRRDSVWQVLVFRRVESVGVATPLGAG